MTSTPRVLIVEDDDAIRSLLVAALSREPLQIDTADDGLVALDFCAIHEYAVIVLDLMMPRFNGFEFLDVFLKKSPLPQTSIIVITAFDDLVLSKLPPAHVHAIVRKPFDVPQLVTMIREVSLASTTRGVGQAPPPVHLHVDGSGQQPAPVLRNIEDVISSPDEGEGPAGITPS